MKFSSGFATLAFALAVSATPVKRTAAQVESDIAAISSQVNTLTAAIAKFASSKSLTDALAIHTDATSLESTINTATTDTSGSAAFTETEGNTILGDVKTLQPLIVTALQNLDAQHDNFKALPVGGIVALVEQDLKTLSSDTTAFENALLAKAPSDLQSQAQTIIASITAAFNTAIATFAS